MSGNEARIGQLIDRNGKWESGAGLSRMYSEEVV